MILVWLLSLVDVLHRKVLQYRYLFKNKDIPYNDRLGKALRTLFVSDVMYSSGDIYVSDVVSECVHTGPGEKISIC
jgi:hypothetical protein